MSTGQQGALIHRYNRRDGRALTKWPWSASHEAAIKGSNNLRL